MKDDTKMVKLSCDKCARTSADFPDGNFSFERINEKGEDGIFWCHECANEHLRKCYHKFVDDIEALTEKHVEMIQEKHKQTGIVQSNIITTGQEQYEFIKYVNDLLLDIIAFCYDKRDPAKLHIAKYQLEVVLSMSDKDVKDYFSGTNMGIKPNDLKH